MPRRLHQVSELVRPVRRPLAIAAMIALLALTLLGPGMTMLGNTETGAGNATRQIGYGIVFFVTIAALRPLQQPERLAVANWPLWVAVLWCWLTLAWSLDPSVSVRRLVLTTIIIWTVFALVRELGTERTLLIIRGILVLFLIGNFAAVFLFPTIGLHDRFTDDPLLVGNWRGLMGHKNQAGLLCALTVLIFSFDRRNMHRVLVLAVVISSLVFLWFSESKTSIVLVVLSAALGLAVSKIKPRGRGWYITAIKSKQAACAIFLLLFPLIHFGIQTDLFLNYVSDSSGLTGRTAIWGAMLRYYFNNPIFAAGFGSFWNIDNASPILTLGEGWVKGISEGHNGYIDLLVTVGLPGLVLILMATFVLPAGRLLLDKDMTAAARGLIGSLLFFCFCHNFTESSLFDRDSLAEVFLMIALAMIKHDNTSKQVRSLTAAPNDRLAQRLNRRASLPTRSGGRESSRR